MGCTSGKVVKTTSLEDLSKKNAAQTNASAPPNKNGQVPGSKSKPDTAIQIPGTHKSFLAPDGIPFIDEDVDSDGEQGDATPNHAKATTGVTATLTTTATPADQNKNVTSAPTTQQHAGEAKQPEQQVQVQQQQQQPEQQEQKLETKLAESALTEGEAPAANLQVDPTTRVVETHVETTREEIHDDGTIVHETHRVVHHEVHHEVLHEPSAGGDEQAPTGREEQQPAVIGQILELERQQTAEALNASDNSSSRISKTSNELTGPVTDTEDTSRQQAVAATKIQAGIRGFLDRKKVKAIRANQQQQAGKVEDHHPPEHADQHELHTEQAQGHQELDLEHAYEHQELHSEQHSEQQAQEQGEVPSEPVHEHQEHHSEQVHEHQEFHSELAQEHHEPHPEHVHEHEERHPEHVHEHEEPHPEHVHEHEEPHHEQVHEHEEPHHEHDHEHEEPHPEHVHEHQEPHPEHVHEHEEPHHEHVHEYHELHSTEESDQAQHSGEIDAHHDQAIEEIHSTEDDAGRTILTDEQHVEVRYGEGDDAKLNQAATKIQANYKGYKTRKSLSSKSASGK